MSRTLVRTALRRSNTQIRYITAVRPAAARDQVAAVYAQLERDFGMLAPPVVLHSPAPGPLAACWLMLRETLVASGRADRAAKEAVAAAVSFGNTCPYCVEVHAAMLYGLAHGPDAAAIAAGQIDSVASQSIRDIAAWALASGQRESAARSSRPFPREHTAEILGVAVTFQYLNRMVNVFLGDSPVPPGVPAAVRSGVGHLLGRFMAKTARERPEPGASLDLLPSAPLPGNLAWAAGSASIEGALGRACAAVDAAGSRSVPEPVRDLVLAALASWDGRPAGLGQGWADAAVSGLAAGQRPAGRLALLTALASYQVVPSDIDAFLAEQPGDQALVELTAWASLAAARRVGSWLGSRPGVRA